MLGSKLLKGSTIGIIAPASPEDEDVIIKKISILKNLGFNIKEGKHLYNRLGFLAGDDKSRAEDLNDMFKDTEVDMIMCFRGGYGTMRMLPYVDFDIIRSNPKIFIGYSDITTLLNSIYQRCNLITFHGPMVSSNMQDEDTLNCFLNTLMYGNKPYILEPPQNSPLVFKNFGGNIQGKVVGGNLTLICSTIGTEYEIDTDDKILFIEEVEEPPYKIDRMLTQLLLCGKLKSCRAILLGQFTGCTLPHYDRSHTLEEVIEDRLVKKHIPICFNFMSGHGMPKLTLPIGSEITLDIHNKIIVVNDKVVE